MIRNICYIGVVLLAAGCGKEEAEYDSGQGILIEAEAPRTDGWSTEKTVGTRSGGSEGTVGTRSEGTEETTGVRNENTEEAVSTRNEGTEETTGVRNEGTEETTGTRNKGTEETAGVRNEGAEETTSVRNEGTEVTRQKGDDGLDMAVSTLPDTETAAAGNATTRWANMDDNIVFRVVAYKSATAAGISTSNYVGYGDYKLSGSTVQTTKSLTVPAGTYTFVCYSYGNANAITAFTNSSTSVSATNGQNFMTYVKPGVAVTNLGNKYTLKNIVFKHRCVRYRVQAIAQNGRMGKITACAGTVTSAKHTAVYSFTGNTFTVQATAGTVNITWSNPSAMNVYSNYTYLLPQSSASITVKLTVTIGGKSFADKSVVLSGLTFSANSTCYSNVSFTTTEGYIVSGVFWANGNLYKSNNQYLLYSATEIYNAQMTSGAYFTCNNLNPYPDLTVPTAAWNDANDPCRKLTNAIGKWRLPTLTEINQLVSSGYTADATLNGVAGFLFGNILFLPYSGYVAETINNEGGLRGLLWTTPGTAIVYANANYPSGAGAVAYVPWNAYLKNCYGVRCVHI